LYATTVVLQAGPPVGVCAVHAKVIVLPLLLPHTMVFPKTLLLIWTLTPPAQKTAVVLSATAFVAPTIRYVPVDPDGCL
jgi:hypothetical protein